MLYRISIVLFLSVKIVAQDSLFFKNGTVKPVKISSVSDEIIKYHWASSDDSPLFHVHPSEISKIKYNDGHVHFIDQLVVSKDPVQADKQGVSDTTWYKKHFLKINFTNIFLNQVSLAYEHQWNRKNGMELELNYNFASPGGTDKWKYNLHYNEDGFEIKPGWLRTLKEFRKSSFLFGVNVSYRYSHISNQLFIVPFSSKIHDVGVYQMSQTRNLGGLFIKLVYRLRYKKAGFDFFVQPGGYLGHNKNTYFSYKDNTKLPDWRSENIPDLKTWYMKDGMQALPYINFGASYRLKYPDKAQRERNRERRVFEADTSYKARNIIKINLTSLLACKIALTYERVFKYKYSWEITPMLIFQNPVYHEVTQIFFPNVSFKNQGFEIQTGINVLNIKRYGRKPVSRSSGFFISYRYQHSDNVNYWTGGISGKGYHYSYWISQTKNLGGVFYKKSFFRADRKGSFSPFFMFGFYAGFARTVCFSYSGNYGSDKGQPMGVYDVGIFSNGFVFMPVARIGFTIRCSDRIIE